MLYRLCLLPLAALCFTVAGSVASAEGPFESDWWLQPQNSVLSFQTIKNNDKVELSSFTTYEGQIDENGSAVITINMDSVETKVDLRNVRLRFLLFETFDHPNAVIKMQVPPAVVKDLRTVRRKLVLLPYTLELAGVERKLETEVIITLIDDNTVAVASAYPISISTTEFELAAGMKKLEETAEVKIIPSATVSFNFTFGRTKPLETPLLGAFPAQTPTESVAEEPTTPLSAAECTTRFDAVTLSGRITFASDSAVLDETSKPLLNSLAKIVARCKDMSIQVAGHTDSTGKQDANQKLSEKRALEVAKYIVQNGVDPRSLSVVGYGASRPVAENETAEGREANRRIEFKIQPKK